MLLYRDLEAIEWPNSGELWQALGTINQWVKVLFSIKHEKRVGKRRHYWFARLFPGDRQPTARPPDKRYRAGQIGENLHNSTGHAEKPGIVLLDNQ